MISYRVSLEVGLLRPGIAPDAVLPAAAAAARARTTVESYDVAIVRGVARINVRFTAADNPEATRIATVIYAAAGDLARVAAPELARRYGSRWHPVRWTS